ncbi:MAG TPA: hypothetical protein VLF71_00785 [Candidatus Saccharimonadales bacterium]|nr:hypothetical protein [Candidatus Saccharimonadales bacterium]
MNRWERRPGEGRMEHLARLSVAKNLGGFAIAASLAVATGGAFAAGAAAFAAAEGVGVGVSHVVQQHLKNRRLRKDGAKH